METIRPLFYVLDEQKNPHPATMEEFSSLYKVDPNTRRVDFTRVGDVDVSTVFLGIDHNFGGEGKPILFETMVFGGEHDGMQRRSCTWDEATKVHKEVCSIVWPKEI